MGETNDGLRVLCVDDDAGIRNLVKAALEKTIRARVDLADSAETALKLLGTMNAPDIFLLDVMMPGMDGYALCQELRRDQRFARVPIIFLSAASSAHEGRAREVGANGYIAKPFGAAQLGPRLVEIVTAHRDRPA
jgi:CheY-like chemotaxis protein